MNNYPFERLSHAARSLNRRAFLCGSALTALAFVSGLTPRRAVGLAPAPIPFALGVASGDPTHDSVVLWTRLAVDPLNGGGMPHVPIEVDWKIGTDVHLRHVVRRGTVLALPEDGHSVHVTVDELAPNRWYWYQFESEGNFSPVGRTRTFPAPDSNPGLLRFAFVSCQHWEAGFYTSWEHLAKEDIDFVIHLGDYVYEDGTSGSGVRQHVPVSEIMTLDNYRNRYAQYRGDVNLQAAHAQFPFIVAWDDHEVEDNYAGDTSQNNRDADPTNDVPPAEFRSRRASAYKAYVEHMPLHSRLSLKGGKARLFRRFDWGRLAQFHVLDTRHSVPINPVAALKICWRPLATTW